ncbi:hypothetical protein [Flavobacterium sp. 3-210]
MSMFRQLSLNEEQKEILKEIRDASYQTLSGRDRNGIPYLKHIFDLHFKIFGETCSTCPNKIGGYIQKLKNFNPEIKMELVKSIFELNDGVIIPVPGTSDVYSKHNLTDEAALKILSKNPNRKTLFRVLPKNIDELLESYVVGLEVEGSGDDSKSVDDSLVSIGNNGLTVEETISLLELINVKTKATTVTGISKKVAELTPEQLKELSVLASDLIAKKQPTEGVKTIEDLKSEYETALIAFQELEVNGSEEEKEVAFKILEAIQTSIEEVEELINKGE